MRHTKCRRKAMRLIFYLPKFLFFSNIKVIPFKVVPLGSYTPTETLFPPLVTALEVFNRYGLQHIHYILLDVFYSPEVTSFKDIFHFRKKVKVTGTEVRWIGSWITTEMPLEVKNSGTERAVRHGTLSWWSIHLSAMFGITRITLFQSLSRTYIKLDRQFVLVKQIILCERFLFCQKKKIIIIKKKKTDYGTDMYTWEYRT